MCDVCAAKQIDAGIETYVSACIARNGQKKIEQKANNNQHIAMRHAHNTMNQADKQASTTINL